MIGLQSRCCWILLDIWDDFTGCLDFTSFSSPSVHGTMKWSPLLWARYAELTCTLLLEQRRKRNGRHERKYRGLHRLLVGYPSKQDTSS